MPGLRVFGFTERQARFLVLVLEHSGVCLPRQYRAFGGIAHGRETHRFFDKLIAGGFATTDLSARAHAGRLYHLQYTPWYRALGEPDHRHRRPMSVGRAIERLMLLDGVLAEAKDYAGAVPILEKAASLNPGFAYAHYYAGLSHYQTKHVDRMANAFERFLKLAPEAPERPAIQALMRNIRR